MRLLKKTASSIKKKGIINTGKVAINYIRLKFRRKVAENNKDGIMSMINFEKYKRIIVFENQFGWEKIMRQRPQQIASAVDDSTLFIYGTTHMEISDNRIGIKKIKDNLFLMDLVIYKLDLIEALKDKSNKYLMIYSTDYIPMEILQPYVDAHFKIIYEYVDGIDEELCGKETSKLLRERHEYIINKLAPYVVATATKLYDDIIKINPKSKVKLITNGVDYYKFSEYKGIIPNDLKKLIKDDNIIIGYYGALASWFDYELIKKIAKSNPKYQIVLIGLNYDCSLNKSGILKIPNVHYLGKKNYEQLSSYLHNFDLCIIPFLINNITLSTSPVKLFEYMAAKKPIITTALPECYKYKSVFIGEDNDDFLNKIEQAYNKLNDKKYLRLLDNEANSNSWDSKFSGLIEFISSGEKNEG